jgi:hypothetical protein
MSLLSIYTNYLNIFQGLISTLTQKLKTPRALSQATASNRHKIFTFTLPLSEGGAGGSPPPSEG